MRLRLPWTALGAQEGPCPASVQCHHHGAVPPPRPKPPKHGWAGTEPCWGLVEVCRAAPGEGEPLFPRAALGPCPALRARRCHPSTRGATEPCAVTMEMWQLQVHPWGKCRGAERLLCSKIISRDFNFYLNHYFHSSPSRSLVDMLSG